MTSKFEAEFTITNVSYCCFEAVSVKPIFEGKYCRMMFHKWAPYPETTVMNLSHCELYANYVPQKIPLSDEEVINWWTSPQVFSDDGKYKGGSYSYTNLPLSDPEWMKGCSLSEGYTFRAELIHKGLIPFNPKRIPKFGPFELNENILPGSENWVWSMNLTLPSGEVYGAYACFCAKTFADTGRYVPMPQEACDVLLLVDNSSDVTCSNGSRIITHDTVTKIALRAINPNTDIGGTLISASGETKTSKDHGKLHESIIRAIQEEQGLNITNLLTARIFNLGTRDDNGRDPRYYTYSLMSKDRDLIHFGFPRYSKTNVFAILVTFVDPEIKDLPHTDIEEIAKTSWVKLSEARKIPSHKFFIPENKTYLDDAYKLIEDLNTLSANEIVTKYQVSNLEIKI